MTAYESTDAKAKALPLAGVKVVEFTHMVMGPTCGMILADLGADVIKIEPPGGESTRFLPGAAAGFFPLYNRNKRSVEWDLKSNTDLQNTMQLIQQSDIVIENFRPGVMAKYGLDYQTLSQLNSKLIYVSLKGFLPGPYENRTALDEVVQMMGGLAYMTGRSGDPLRAGASVNDIMGGMFGAIGAMGALMQRAVTGRGQEIQSGLFETNVFLVAQHMLQFAMTGEAARPMPERKAAFSVYDVFTVKGGEQIFLAAVSDTHWQIFCNVLGFTDLGASPLLATNTLRVLARDTLLPELRARLSNIPAADLAALFETSGLPFAYITRPDELYQDPHLRATGVLSDIRLTDGDRAGNITQTALLPLLMDGALMPVRNNPPSVGEHTEEVVSSLGTMR